jgi:amino acid transporter
MVQQKGPGLFRGIRRWDLVAFIINLIIGAGIFGLPSKVFHLAGSYSIIAYMACSILMALIMLCFAEVSSRFTATGGPYLYALRAFGSFIGYEIGWLMWLTRVTVFAAVCNLLIAYIAFFWPSASSSTWRALLIAGFVLSLTTVNLIGVRRWVAFNNIFAIGKLIPIILFIIVGLFFIEPRNFSFAASPDYYSVSNAMMILIFAFTGFEFSTINAGEVRDPRRNFPFGMLIVLIFVSLLYILIQIVCIGTLPELADSDSPLADAANRFTGPMGALIITFGAVVSMTGSLNAILLGCTRIPFALAEQKQAPKILQMTHPRFKTPYISILISAAAILVVSLTYSFMSAVTMSVIIKLITTCIVCISLPVLRFRKDTEPAKYKIHGGFLVATLAFIICLWLLSHSTGGEIVQLVIAVSVGFVLYIAFRLRKR